MSVSNKFDTLKTVSHDYLRNTMTPGRLNHFSDNKKFFVSNKKKAGKSPQHVTYINQITIAPS